jgi:hypothetical protein
MLDSVRGVLGGRLGSAVATASEAMLDYQVPAAQPTIGG